MNLRSNPVTRARAIFLVAAFASFVFSVSLYFTGSENQGIYVGLWVPSIIALGAFLAPRDVGTRRRRAHGSDGSPAMSNIAIFLVGLPITMGVFAAMGILVYGIKLESVQLESEQREREAAAGLAHEAEAPPEVLPTLVSKRPLTTAPVETPLNAA